MLNQQKKANILKTTVTLSMVFVLWFLIAILFGYFFVIESRTNYLSNCTEVLSYTQDELTSELVAVHTDLTKIPWNDGVLLTTKGLAGYNSVIFVNKDEESTTTLYNLGGNNAVVSKNLTNRALRELTEETEKNGVYNTVASDLFMFDDPSGDSAAYYIAAIPAGSGYIALTKKMSVIVGKVPQFRYENIMMLVYDGKSIYNFAKNSISYEDLESIASIDLALLSQNRKESYVGRVGSANKIISISDNFASLKNIKIVTYQTDAVLQSQVNNIVLKHVLESVTIFVIFSFGFVSLILLMFKGSDNALFVRANSSYIVNINLQGKVRWANNNFRKNFEYANISGSVNSASGDTLQNCLLLGKPIVLDLVDGEGENHNIIMSTLRHYGMFRLIGSDMTATMSDYNLLKRADTYDKITDMPLEKLFLTKIDSIIANGNGISGITAILRINNKGTLKSMLGEHTYNNMMSIFAGVIKKTMATYLSGDLYYMRNGDILLFNPKTAPSNDISQKMEKVMQELSAPIKLNDTNIQLDVRCGVVIFNTKEKDVTGDVLISNAHMALDNAVDSLTQHYYVLYPTNFTAARTNFTADGVVKNMIANGEIAVFFQPQMDIASKRIVGFEALTRIVGDKAKEIKIMEFIEIAEHYGGMIDLGYFVAEKAMQFAESIQKYGISVSVNVSPIQLMQAGFVDNFIKLYDGHAIDKGFFNVEITESAALYNFEEVVSKLNALQSVSIGIHIDDFGVAYSSMLHLKMLPATALKIDKSLIDDIAFNKEAVFIVRNIINLARDLLLTTIAEGAEKQDQLDKLEELGCDTVQGYIVGQALPFNNAIELIKGVNKND